MTKKSNIIDLSNLTYETKKNLYLTLFTSASNTSNSFDKKLELITLICILSQQLQYRASNEFHNTYEVMTKYILGSKGITEYANEEYISGLCIVCDDLLYGTNPIQIPPQYKGTQDIKQRILELLSEWTPF